MLPYGKRTAGCTIALLFASTGVAMAHGNGGEGVLAFTIHGVGGGLLVLLFALFFVKSSWRLKLGLFALSPFLALAIGFGSENFTEIAFDPMATDTAAWFGFLAEVLPSLLILATIHALRRFRRSKAALSNASPHP